jgi:hypothetical protein
MNKLFPFLPAMNMGTLLVAKKNTIRGPTTFFLTNMDLQRKVSREPHVAPVEQLKLTNTLMQIKYSILQLMNFKGQPYRLISMGNNNNWSGIIN